MSAPASAEFDGAAPEDWANLPTKASVKAQSRRAAQAQQAAAIAAYRVSHDVPAGMSDATVWALIFIEQVGRGNAGALTGTRAGRDARQRLTVGDAGKEPNA